MQELNFQLTALPANLDCFLQPRLSQVCTFIMVPLGSPLPSDWTQEGAFDSIINNTSTSNEYGKQLFGVGEVPDASPVIISMGLSRKLVGYRKQLNLEIQIRNEAVYQLLQHLQLGFNSFSFWFGNIGGTLIGGPSGIIPELVYVDFPSGGAGDSIELANLTLQWYEYKESGRTDQQGIIQVEQIPTLITDDTGTVVTDDSGATIGIF